MHIESQAVHKLRIFSRLWSLLSIAFVLTMFIGEGLSGEGPMPTAVEWVGLALFPGGVFVGLVLGWRREGLGGAIAVLSLIAFYVWEYAYSGDLAGGPFFLLVAAPGFLFLLCWRLTRHNQAQPRPA